MYEGKPAFCLLNQAKVLRKAMVGGYCYRRLQVSGLEKYAEKPDKNKYSHVAEALQYMFLGAGEGFAVIANPDQQMTPEAIKALERKYLPPQFRDQQGAGPLDM